MVQVQKGILVKCDPVMKQFLLHLDENKTLGQKFVLVDLDDCHLFLQSDIYNSLKARIDELYEKIYYNTSGSSQQHKSFE